MDVSVKFSHLTNPQYLILSKQVLQNLRRSNVFSSKVNRSVWDMSVPNSFYYLRDDSLAY